MNELRNKYLQGCVCYACWSFCWSFLWQRWRVCWPGCGFKIQTNQPAYRCGHRYDLGGSGGIMHHMVDGASPVRDEFYCQAVRTGVWLEDGYPVVIVDMNRLIALLIHFWREMSISARRTASRLPTRMAIYFRK